MNIVPFEAFHMLDLQLQMAQQGIAPFITGEYARALEGEFAFTALVEGKVIAIGGVVGVHEGRGVVWSLIDREAGPHFLSLHHAAKRLLGFVPYRRLEADVDCEFEQGHRWLRMLGFKMEVERMEAYQVDGSDSSLYARVQ